MRESRKFEEGLNTKFKLDINFIKWFDKSVEFNMEDVCDAGSIDFSLLDRVHLVELGRHRGKEGKTECSLCGNECENVSHVLWECSACS